MLASRTNGGRQSRATPEPFGPRNSFHAEAFVDERDAAEADRVFDMLMGSSVPPRKRFIQTNAKLVKNLDV